ncbi:uncharacterized protein A1O5_00363 [Cladophialophora psammophila CBS 110553]|uniref:Uncharacterized protein n=1 Tax=Cladophialophora psammophila CBS 110553 TaxID=1182543 RepID=W9XG13_9EURO|nr:uncharacterized protein A1O5_00363 [Cladophialophora psammophila CBS 110553]EXJ75856.1 hypothetical protein A1O5_00363 [Cladophialophora psammophila CBS 110553]
MSDSSATKTSGGLTARESEVVIAALHCVKGGDIQIDYAALMNRLGFKTEASARSAWCGVKRKLVGDAAKASPPDEQGTSGKSKTPRKPKDSNTTATPKSGKKATKVEAADKDAGNDSGDGENNIPATAVENTEVNTSEEPPPATPKTALSTPKKRGRKTKAEKEAEAAANSEAATGEGDEEEEKPAKKRRTPAKKKATASENNGGNEDETPATPVKGKKTVTPRKKAAVTATNKAPANDAPPAVPAVNVKEEEEGDVSAEENTALATSSTETANSPVKGVTNAAAAAVNRIVCDTVMNAAAEVIAARANEALAAADTVGDD